MIYKAPRLIYRIYKRIGLKNKNFTLLSNNCCAGIILHDLNLEFKTPTINLYISFFDFLFYVENLEYFLKGNLIEVFDDNYKFPLGDLICEKGKIRIYFMHYSSFEDARIKWEKRSKKINLDKIYVLMEGLCDDLTVFKKFNDLKINNKVFLTNNNPLNSTDVICLNVYNNYRLGKILLENEKFPYKRYLDEFNYVKFFNSDKAEREL